MASGEFKARAAYDFVGEGVHELSFRTNEILTITSTTAGQGWWHAKNSIGNVGVIPANYVQALVDPPEPNEPPPPLSNTYPNLGSFSGNGYDSRTSSQSSYPPPPDPNQYMNSAHWPSEPLPWSSKPAKHEHTNNNKNNNQEIDSDFSDPETEQDSRQPSGTNLHTPVRQQSITRTNTLPTGPGGSRTSMVGGEATRAPPRARFFDKHGLDNYLLNGCKTKSDEHVEIAFDDREGGVYWSPNPGNPPFTCKVDNPSKGQKFGGLKAYMEYKIHAQIHGGKVVGRRYKQFDWLHEQLVNKFRFICIPPLPSKQIAGRFEQEFIEERRRQLELWLNRVCRHPVLCASIAVQHFVTCELTEKNNKDWKAGKRRIEKDDSREAPWLQCVVLTNTGLSDQQIVSQIEVFAQQQPNLETQLRNLNQGLSKYMEKHVEVYERDIQRVSELFGKLHVAIQADNETAGNKELSTSVSKISTSYSGVADLYKTKATEGLRDFLEHIQDYIGLIACFPSILNIQRSATEFMRTIQQRPPSAAADFSNAIHRNHVLNHVVLAEINFFQREKVRDFNVYMKTLVDEQIQFFEKVTAELQTASGSFR